MIVCKLHERSRKTATKDEVMRDENALIQNTPNKLFKVKRREFEDGKMRMSYLRIVDVSVRLSILASICLT